MINVDQAKVVRELNAAGRFTFCTFECDKARSRGGVLQVRTTKTWDQEGGWMRVIAWIEMSYAPEDHDDALMGAFCTKEGNRFKLAGMTRAPVPPPVKCSSGPTALFPDVVQCERPVDPARAIFGDPYCRECSDRLVELHARMNQQPPLHP